MLTFYFEQGDKNYYVFVLLLEKNKKLMFATMGMGRSNK